MKFFEEKSRQFYLFLEETFNLNKCKSWNQLAGQVTIERIKKTYKFFSILFPQNYNYHQEFNPSNNFSTIRYNRLNGNSILNEIVKFSLYSDEVYVFHPIQNPSITNNSLNPIKKPRAWISDFLSALYFYVVLKKWVELGIVKLIINPVDFDQSLQREFSKQAQMRTAKRLKQLTESDYEDTINSFTEDLANIYGNRSIEAITKILMDLENPKFTSDEATKMAIRVKDARSRVNPLYDNLNIPLRSGIVSSKSGGSIEEIAYISQITNSNIYTSNKAKWEMLSERNLNDFWNKANYSMSKAELPFLDNVDTGFVLSLRKEGQLSKLRHELKEIFGDLNSIDASQITDRKIYEVNERFIDAINSSEADWEKIKSEAEAQRRNWFPASVAFPIIQQEATILSLIGAGLGLSYSVAKEKINLNHFKKTNALSVYVDLKNRHKGFFSDIKNCLF